MKQLVVTTLAIIAAISTARADDPKPDMKFMKEAAGIVWGQDDPRFNPRTELPDSLITDNSATVIAVSNIFDASRQEATPFGPYRGFNRQYLGETTVDYYSRRMVRLNDAKGVEEFSNYKIRAKREEKVGTGFVVYSTRQAFGARIHKPDGSVVDVDVSQALPETEGKKNKVSQFRLAIPNLEPGDVLETFTFNRTYMLGDQKTGTDIRIFMPSPTVSYRFEARFDKILTAEINTFNGLDQSAFTTRYGEERDTVSVEFSNIERFDEPRFCNPARQLPYMRVTVADNYSRVFGHPASSRRPGLYFNLTPPVIMAEIAERYSERDIPVADVGKAWGHVKKYIKDNPGCTWEQKADACWLAARYVAIESKKSYNDWDVVSLFKDVVDKAKLEVPARLAAVSSRNDIPVLNIAGYDQATPLVIIGDRTYIHDLNLVYRPGETPGMYQGEVALTLDGNREKVYDNFKLGIDTLADSRSRDNNELINISAAINPDNNNLLDFAYTSTTSGLSKAAGSAFLKSSDIIELIEQHLGINEKKRSKMKFDLMAIDDSRRKALEALPEIDFSLQDLNIDSVSILSPGFLPDNETFVYRITGSTDGLVTHAGNDILISIGNLVGAASYSQIDRTKPRDIDIVTRGPYNLRYTLKFELPQGYKVDPESLQQLQVNKANRCGSYFVQTTCEPDNNTVTIITNYRNNRRFYPAAVWNEFLDLRDAAIAFADATLILTPQ